MDKREIVVISSREPTCKTANGDSTIDFFVVDTLLAQATGAIALLDLHALKTHTHTGGAYLYRGGLGTND